MKILTLIFFLTPLLYLHAERKCFTPYSDMPEKELIKQNKIQNPFLFTRSDMNESYQTSSGKFTIHYDTQGLFAVDLTDRNNNSIPDYIDTVAYYIEYSYEKEVEELGFQFRYSDNGLGETDNYDIYVKDLGSEGYYGGVTLDEVFYEGTDSVLATSFMVIDNNYSETDSFEFQGELRRTYTTTGYDGLKVTLIHEFHHSIQFYMKGDSRHFNRSLPEMTSTYMEYRFFPEIPDYLSYLNYLFQRTRSAPFTSVNDIDAGYAYGIFFQHTYKKYGDGVLLKVWNNISDSLSHLAALDSTLKDYNSDLSLEFCDFISSVYYTGERTNNNSVFDLSAEFPEINYEETYNLSNRNDISYGSGLAPFTFGFFRVNLDQKNQELTKDTLDVAVVNSDISEVYTNNQKISNALIYIDKSELQGYSKFENLNLYYQDNSDINICLKFFEKPGDSFEEISYSYPEPFVLGRDESLFFPSPENAGFYQSANIKLYTVDGNLIFEGTKTFSVNNENKVIRVEASELNISPGVYIFKISVDDKSLIGKTTIVSR